MPALVKTLSATSGAGLMLNIVIGAGLLALPGLVVEAVGSHALWAWAVCAITAIPLLIVFIIMGRRFPNAGGIAHFSKIAFGSVAYIATSFIFLGAVAFGLPAIALIGGHYISEIVPGHPALYAALFIMIAASSHLISAEISGKISTIIASGILVSLLLLIFIGLYTVNWENINDKIVPISAVRLEQAFLPFMMIFFAFTGWEVAASTAEEFKNPERDFPRAMVMSFFAACLIYFAMAFVTQSATITGSYEAPFVVIAGIAFGDHGRFVIAILATIIVFANLMGAIWAVSRMVLSLSRENYLPLTLKTNNNGLPVSSVIITAAILLGVLSAGQLEILDINRMLALAGQNFLILYGITGLALFKLSKHILEKLLSVVTILIVLTLLFIQGVFVFYPICLSIIAIIIWYIKKD